MKTATRDPRRVENGKRINTQILKYNANTRWLALNEGQGRKEGRERGGHVFFREVLAYVHKDSRDR